MVRPQPKPKSKTIAMQVKLATEEDQKLADEASRRGCSKSDVIRAWIAQLPKGKPSKG
jgi:hypothetical protein